MRTADSLHRVIRGVGAVLVVLGLLTSTVTADQTGIIQRQGFFKVITEAYAQTLVPWEVTSTVAHASASVVSPVRPMTSLI